jgi:hypothetical protein
LCRGTASFVHVSCLAQWRTLSVGRASFHACDVCGYRYAKRRASFASVLEWETPVWILAALLMSALVATVAAACSLSGLQLHMHFYRNVMWVPPWHGGWLSAWMPRWLTQGAAAHLDTLVSGLVVCGCGGTLASALRQYRRDEARFWQAVAPAVSTAFLTAGTPALRVFVVGGLGWGIAWAAHALKLKARDIMTRFGEHVLDISERSS